MTLIDEVLSKLGAIYERTHVFTFTKASAPGAQPRFTRDLRPLPGIGLTAGHLVELYAILDERYDLDATATVRLDVLEEDWLFTGGLDDRVISLLGTGAQPPETGAPTRQLTTSFHELTHGEDVTAVVEDFKRTSSAASQDYADTILLLKENPSPGTRRTHVIGWHRLEHDDIGSHSELYFVLDVAGVLHAASPVLEIEAAPQGSSVRLSGTVIDQNPLDTHQPEPLESVPVTLRGRLATSGADGTFVLDARLPVGDHQLLFSRAGIDNHTLTVRVSADANGVVTAAVLDGADELVSDTTPQAATEASLVTLELPDPVVLLVHKLRGTVRWPDTRGADADAGYLGTPLAERRVCVLPLAAAAALADSRPRTTAEREALGTRPAVLRSARPGRPSQKERTDLTGAFEVKYVDFTAGNRFLLWVERLAADGSTEAADHVVRTLRRELIAITGANLATTANAGNVDHKNRLLVDHEFNLTRDPVPWGVDALRVADLPDRTLVRPDRQHRELFDTQDPLVTGTGEQHAVPAYRIVEGLELQVLPLVPLDEPADAQGQAAAAARQAIASSAAVAFPDGYDAGAVTLALDVSRLQNAIDWTAAPGWTLAADDDARQVELLEQTLVVRPQLGRGRTLGVDQARWYFDAVSLADSAFVAAPAGGAPSAASRRLDAAFAGARQAPTHLPVLASVAPMLPALAPRRVYLAPGHGLYVLQAPFNSTSPASWGSNRGGYSGGAGEDEVDGFLSSEVRRIVRQNGGTLVPGPRELEDFTTPGVTPGPAPDPDFPRGWQQNPLYHLGEAGMWQLGDKNGQGINARTAHIRALAQAPTVIDLVLATHTNASGVGARGCVVEYLNASPAPRAAGEGNPLGQALSQRVRDRILARTHIDQYGGGVRTMDALNSESVADLVETFDHWVLADPGIDVVCRERVRGPTTAAAPAVPNIPPHSAGAVACYNRLPNPRTHGAAPVPPIAAVPANGHWEAKTFPGAAVREIPVALCELAFHDQQDDARLLSRPWFRRLAAEAMAMGIQDQLRANTSAVTFGDVRAVLARVFGNTTTLRGLADPGAITAASIGNALRAVADPGAADPAGTTLDALTGSALAAARALTRQQLVDLIRDELRVVAGWEATDQQATVDTWVREPITYGAPLSRPAAVPTRDEAGALACSAIGLVRAGLTSAQTVPVGAPAEPLLGLTPAAASAYFTRAESALLTARLRTLRPTDVYRMADAWLASATWARFDSQPGVYELDPGTPVVVVVRTAGAAWKTVNQSAANALQDIEIRLETDTTSRKLACAARTNRQAVSATWLLDLPGTGRPVSVNVELWARHRTEGRKRVGVKLIQVMVRAPAV